MTGGVRTILTVVPRPGCRDAVIEAYRTHRIIETAVEGGGCLRGELLVPDDPHAPLLVVCAWRSRAAYADWVAHRPASASALDGLIEAPGGLPAGAVLQSVIDTAESEAHR